MAALEMNLPKHLYTETADADGVKTGTVLEAVKLLAWAGHGYGDDISNYCRKAYDSEILVIDSWQETRLLLLEEQWLEAENDVDDDAAERQFERACDAVIRKADRRRDAAGARMVKHKSAIEIPVQEAEQHLAESRPAEDEETSMGLLFALIAAGALIYTLLS